MEELIKKLADGVATSPDVSIRKRNVWRLPVVHLDVSYDRVKRLKMDILMKMLLFAFQQSDIRRAATLADMLSVEELFVSDLIHKMKRTGLIVLGKKGYVLTPKGHDYLEKGIYEEALDGGEALVSFSPAHGEYRLAEEGLSPVDEQLAVYRYATEAEPDSERMLELLAKEKNSTEEGFQILVTAIADMEERESAFIPCIEFQLYDRKQDIFYARIWNVATDQWDEALEKQVEEHELVEWREAMKAEEAEANASAEVKG